MLVHNIVVDTDTDAHTSYSPFLVELFACLFWAELMFSCHRLNNPMSEYKCGIVWRQQLEDCSAAVVAPIVGVPCVQLFSQSNLCEKSCDEVASRKRGSGKQRTILEFFLKTSSIQPRIYSFRNSSTHVFKL